MTTKQVLLTVEKDGKRADRFAVVGEPVKLADGSSVPAETIMGHDVLEDGGVVLVVGKVATP